MSKVIKRFFNKKLENTDFFELAVKSQIIVFHMGSEKKGQYVIGQIRELVDRLVKQPLPFAHQFIELVPPIQTYCYVDNKNCVVTVEGIQISEHSPDDYKIFIVGTIETDRLPVQDILWGFRASNDLNIKIPEGMQHVCLLIVGVSITILELINSRSEFGETKANFVLKKGFGKSALRHEIKRIVHIRPYKKLLVSEYESQKIDWSHRWKVRGHWRKVNTIGKDRSGKYGVDGFTWVIEHLKGPEEKELIQKKYLVTSRNQ